MVQIDISFDEHMEMPVLIEDSNAEVCLALSDGLNAYDEELTDAYKGSIVAFLQHSSLWYGKAAQAVLTRAKQVYGAEVAEQTIQLMKIYILFEQNEPPLFGLSFRTEFDVEHGCGLKIRGAGYDIVEIGTADVAFC